MPASTLRATDVLGNVVDLLGDFDETDGVSGVRPYAVSTKQAVYAAALVPGNTAWLRRRHHDLPLPGAADASKLAANALNVPVQPSTRVWRQGLATTNEATLKARLSRFETGASIADDAKE